MGLNKMPGLKPGLLFYFGRGGEIRTPINGFGDHYSALELHPYERRHAYAYIECRL